MFYGQCFACGNRWGLGTKPTCTCKEEQNNLREDEIFELADKYLYSGKNYDILAFARAIEDKIKEKNT